MKKVKIQVAGSANTGKACISYLIREFLQSCNIKCSFAEDDIDLNQFTTPLNQIELMKKVKNGDILSSIIEVEISTLPLQRESVDE